MKERIITILLLLFIALLTSCLLNGCAEVPQPIFCQHIKNWTATEQSEMAIDLDTLPQGSILKDALIDYARMRDEARACQRAL